MNEFYLGGKIAALEKVGFNPIKAFQGLKPGTQGLLKRLGVGSAVGAAGGALVGGEDNRLQGALGGALVGGGLGAAAPALRAAGQHGLNKGMEAMSKLQGKIQAAQGAQRFSDAASKAFGAPKGKGTIITDPRQIAELIAKGHM